MATYTTGGNLPPLEKVYTTGGNLPAEQAPSAPPAPGSQGAINAAQNVNSAMGTILDNNSPYMQNARRTGLDHARTRGLLNSSIAAGNSQAAAISAAQPMLNNAMDIFGRRENQEFTKENMGLAHAYNKDTIATQFQNLLQQNQQQANLSNWLSGENHVRSLASASHTAGLQNWLSSESYTREFNGALSMLPVMNSFQLGQLINQYAVTNPQAYPPNVVSGLTNFLNQNMFSILKEYFPNLVRPAGGT